MNIKFSKSINLNTNYKYINVEDLNISTIIGSIRYKVKNRILYIDNIRICETYQQKGIGKELLEFLIKKYNLQAITSTEDGFTKAGKNLMNSLDLSLKLKGLFSNFTDNILILDKKVGNGDLYKRKMEIQ